MYYFPNTLEGFVNSEFFAYALPWLLTFAIIYGILSHVGKKEDKNGKPEGIPKSNASRVIISLVFAFLVAPVLSGYIGVLMEMTGMFIIVIGGLLVFIVFLELLKIRVGEDGKKKPIFQAHVKTFAVILGIISILIFNASGGFDALGWNMPQFLPANPTLLFFFVVVVLMVWWMASEDSKDSE